MEWSDEGIVLGVRRHGETSAIVELMTPERGRHLGLVRGGISRNVKPYLQPGNSVRATWRARLDEHLGNFTIEGTVSRADRLMASAPASYCIQTLAALLRLLPERDPHPALYEALCLMVDHLDQPAVSAPMLVRFELLLLAELGFGARPRRMRGDGRRGGPHLCLAQVRASSVAAGRRALEDPASGPAGVPEWARRRGNTRRRGCRLRSDRILPAAPGFGTARGGTARGAIVVPCVLRAG
jgi:recombinational DNA repair protein (RecF pathway)